MVHNLYTTEQVSILLDLSPNAVARLCRNGTFTARKLGRSWMIAREQFFNARHPRGNPRWAEKEKNALEATQQHNSCMSDYSWLNDLNALLPTAKPVAAYAMGTCTALARVEGLEPDAKLFCEASACKSIDDIPSIYSAWKRGKTTV